MENVVINRAPKVYLIKIFNKYTTIEKFYFINKDLVKIDGLSKKEEFRKVIELYLEEFLTGEYFEVYKLKRKNFSKRKFQVILKSKIQPELLNEMLFCVEEV